jgi:hypothetical protein
MRRADEKSARALVMGTRQSVLSGRACVATTRPPSALAASDVYLSMPTLTRREMRRSMSRL